MNKELNHATDFASSTTEPAFLDDDGPSNDVPRHVTITNMRELFDMRDGESLMEAIARKGISKAK